MYGRILALSLIIIVVGLVLVGCAAPAQAPAAPEPAEEVSEPVVEEPAAEPEEAVAGGALTIGLAVEPVSLHPAAGLYLHEHLVLMNLYDPLLRADQEGNLHPGLATAWEQSEDGTEFTFTLRDDVTFHDGTPFDAEAVKANFDRIAAGDFGWASAPTVLAGYTGSEVVDDTTLKVTFEIPKPTFLIDLSRYWMGIASPTAVEAQGDAYGQNPVGTGPFVFDEWAAQDHLTLTRNPDYNVAAEFATHDGPALLDEITFRFLPEAATRLTALQTGEVQVAEEPPGLEVQPLVETGDFVLEQYPAPGMPSHMMINVEKSPTDDIHVRQVMIHAINQQELVDTAFSGLMTPVYSVLSPSTWGYNEEAAALYRYDLEKAAALLDEAGWVDEDGDGIREKDGEPLKVVYPAIPAYEEAFMELVAGYLNQVGFEVELTTMDDAGVFEFGNAGNHNFLNMGWISSDPAVLDIVYNSANIEQGSSFTRYVDEELDQALVDAQSELDGEARKAMYVKAQQIIMDNALIMPLHTYN
ncbi:MAG: ABC transporter substrate-binding protein [Chloroflexi bacterium]|nr:ABC transporter substrate-binding protein [Chloroflexota bacterium]